jgi:tetratricopeptide (TPR) repeat protein
MAYRLYCLTRYYNIACLVILWTVFSVINASAQSSRDSLENLLATTPNDNGKVEILRQLSEQYLELDVEKLLLYSKAQYDLSVRLRNTEGQIIALANIGLAYVKKNQPDKAMGYYLRGVKLAEETNNVKDRALCYIRMGILYRNLNNFENAIECLNQSTDLYRQTKNNDGLATSLINLGAVYYDMVNLDASKKKFEDALVIYKELGDELGTADALCNISVVCQDKGQYEQALSFNEQAKNLYKKLGIDDGVVTCLINMGYIYDMRGDHKKALDIHKECLLLTRKLNSAELLAGVYYGLGETYKNLRNADSSFKYMNLYAQYKDTLINAQSNRNIADMKTKYETDKKEKENQILKQEKQIKDFEEREKKQAEIRKRQARERRDNLQYSIILIVILFLVMSLVFIGGSRVGFLSARVVEGLIFFSFLIFFEFVLVLGDPLVDNVTGGAPGWKLLINAVVAAAIFPIHAFFEKILKKKLIKKQ